MMETIHLFDGHHAKPLPAGFDKKGFLQYLDQVWQERPLLLQENDDEEERRSTKQRFFVIEDGRIRAKNYTGFVQFNDCRIHVYPRVFSAQNDFSITNALGHLVKWLSYSHRLQFPFSSIPADTSHQDDWLEAFIFLFGYYTGNVVRDMPHQAYEEVTGEMGFMRGQIAMQPYITENLAKGSHHRLYCRYEPFVYDNLYNQIVKYTSQLLLTITNESRNVLMLKEIAFVLDEVTDIICTASDCDKVKLNRLYPEKEQVLQLCRWFLQMLQTDASQSDKQNLCLLLPMEVIFEEYIAGFLLEHFSHLSPRPQAQDLYLAENGKGNSIFKMIHDILIPGKLIIDTKYKFRLSDDDKKGVSQHDMYQMISYLYKRQVNKGMLLYPEMSGGSGKDNADFTVLDELVQIRSIDVTEIDVPRFDELQKIKMANMLYSIGLDGKG